MQMPLKLRIYVGHAPLNTNNKKKKRWTW